METTRLFQEYASSGDLNELKIGGATADDAVAPKSETGMMAFGNSGDLVLSLTTSFQKVALFDVTLVNSPRGHMTYDAPNKKATLNTDGVYKFRADGSIEAPTNDEIEFTFYVNGVQFNPSSNPIFTGRGAGKPIGISAQLSYGFTAGDTIEIYAKSSASGTTTVKAFNYSIEKTTY
jgi:hypothetical protein